MIITHITETVSKVRVSGFFALTPRNKLQSSDLITVSKCQRIPEN